MNYIRLIYAVLIGALMTVATRFGPSLTIFAFVYLSRYSGSFTYSAPMTPSQWLIYYLPLASMLAGIGAYLIRLVLKNYSTALDHRVLPFVDYLTLRHIEKWNLNSVTIRSQSVLGLRLTQTLCLLVILSGVIAVISIQLSVLAFLIIGFAVAVSLLAIKKGINSTNLATKTSQTENIIEQTLMAAMIIGCVLFVSRDQWLHAAVGLFVLARFVMSYRLIAKTILQWAVVRQTKPIPSRPLPVVKTPAKPTTVTAATAPKLD
jgi:hypothetical protein